MESHHVYNRVVQLDPKELKVVKGNRPLDLNHVAKLKRAIQQQNLLGVCPIRINQRNEVIDGQHRVQAAIELGLDTVPCFVVCATLKEAQVINQHMKNWSLMDFARSWAARGLKDYQDFVEFRELTGFSAGECMAMLSGTMSGGGSESNFKSGNFKVKSFDKALKTAEMIESFKSFFQSYDKHSFVLACLSIFKVKGYDHATMLHKLTLCSISPQPSMKHYLAELQRIYNFKQPQNRRLMFVDL